MANIIKHPDYIIVDTKHKDTGLVIKQFDKNVIVVLKLKIPLLQFGKLRIKDCKDIWILTKLFTKQNKYAIINI